MSIKLFSNMLVYRLRDPSALHLHEDLNAALATKPARMPSATELNAWGFAYPTGEEDLFVERVQAQALVFKVGIAERLMPGGVVRDRVQTRVNQIQEQEQRRVYAREKNQIKDEVITKMLPAAFIQRKAVFCMIQGPYIILDTSSAKTGESILSMLRDVLGTLSVRPVSVKETPIGTFTQWFTRQETDCEFRLTGDFQANANNDENDSLNGKGTSPESEGLSDLVLATGRRVIKLTLLWPCDGGEHLSMTVNEMIGIKGVKWPESIMDKAGNDAGERGEDETDAEYNWTLLRATLLLLSAEIARLIPALLTALGGEELHGEELTTTEQFERKLVHLEKAFKELQERSPFRVVKTRDTRDDLTDELPDDDEEEDGTRLYEEAVAYVQESKRASISAVQRKFKLGYNRAARMIERMEEDGLVTAINSNGSREVITTRQRVTQVLDDLV